MKSVQLENPVVFQINGHLNETFPASAGGILLGTGPNERPARDTVRVTESFALPQHIVESSGTNVKSDEAVSYTKSMISKLEFVGADNHIEGWYLSSSVAAIYDAQVFDNLFAFQETNPDSFLLVHDVALSRATGTLGLRAFQLSEEFLAVRRAGSSKISTEQLLENELDYSKLLEELSVEIVNPALVAEFVSAHAADPGFKFESLRAPRQDLLENSADSAMEAVDDFNYEQGNYNYYQRQLVREKQKIAAWQAKRKAENTTRVEQDQKPLPEDEWKSLFKLPEEPSRLENLLLSAQLDESCTQVEELAGTSGSMIVATKYTA